MCPGVLRPWIADDGALIRLRIPGGEIKASTLAQLMGIARKHADGNVHLTKRANLQLRGIAHQNACVSPDLIDEITAAGLLPSPTHELIRNILVSPLTGRSGGRADLRPVTRALDLGLLAEPELAALPGRFLFVLDDGRGDVAHRNLDLGAFAVDEDSAQLRIGRNSWGPIVPIEEIAPNLVLLAQRFLTVRGEGPKAPWHVDELPAGTHLTQPHAQDLRTHITSLPLPISETHVAVSDGILTPALADDLIDRSTGSLIVTPWRSVVLP